jgi:hypothetical protein
MPDDLRAVQSLTNVMCPFSLRALPFIFEMAASVLSKNNAWTINISWVDFNLPIDEAL